MANCRAGYLDDDTPGHNIPGRHYDGCDQPDTCHGCYTAQALPGLEICAWHEARVNEALRALPDTWVDLAEPANLGKSRTGDDLGDDGDDRLTERTAIRSTLVEWCKILHTDFDVHLPDETVIAGTTRKIAGHHSDQARRARDAATLLDMPALGNLHPDRAGYRTLKAEEKRHLDLAQAARDDRETGRDILRALCEHLKRQKDRLLASPTHAPKFTNDLVDTYADARVRANPCRSHAIRVRCECGNRVPINTVAGEDTTCRNCGSTAVATWWLQHNTDDDTQPATALDLAGWLIVRHHIDLGPSADALIRQWAVRYPDTILRAGKDQKKRITYHRAGVLAVAQRHAAKKHKRTA